MRKHPKLGGWLRRLADRVDEKEWDFNEVAMLPPSPVDDTIRAAIKNNLLPKQDPWIGGWAVSWPIDPNTPAPLRCVYDIKWTDEVGDIFVCRFHGQNSRHKVTSGLDKDCLTLDPYPERQWEPGLDI